MNSIAVYGGSFDPPHMGHALVIQYLLWSGKADHVLVVPAFRHAFGKDSRPYKFRVKLCQAMSRHFYASMGSTRVSVSEVEAELARQTENPIYTYDVLIHLQKRFGDSRLRLVVGADVLGDTNRWHRWKDIHVEFNPIIIGREGYPAPKESPVMPGFSSTELRRRLAEGEDWKSWVLPEVRKMLPGPYGATAGSW